MKDQERLGIVTDWRRQRRLQINVMQDFELDPGKKKKMNCKKMKKKKTNEI